MSVLDRVPAQDTAIAFLRRALDRPHHAYLLTGPEGSGKLLAARAFTAALLCPNQGCGACRDCRLALDDRHPNVLIIEPEGRDILVGQSGDDHGTARWMVAQAFLTAPEGGRKVFRIEQADRVTEEAADVLLKALEEPPSDTVFLLSSARPHELPETVRSRCHTVTFRSLAESFVVGTLTGEGIPEERALLAARLSGGNVGRARRVAADPQGLAFRDAAVDALRAATTGPGGALSAAASLMAAAKAHRERFAVRLDEELEPLLDPDTGRPYRHLRTEVKRVTERHHRRERRAEREFLDASLLALGAWLRDALLRAAGGDPGWSMNLDIAPPAVDARSAAAGIDAVEEARAALADETNLNPRLVVEAALLRLSELGLPA